MTISFSESTQGWSSFYSYDPEWLLGLNNFFYSFKRGNLWKHNSIAVPVCNFYSTQNNAVVEFSVNKEPTVNKLFKAISLDSNQPWSASIETDVANQIGSVGTTQYELKENMYFSNIVFTDPNPSVNSRSVVGIGNVSIPITGTGVDRTFTFQAPVSNSVNIGDRIAVLSGGSLLINGGTVQSISSDRTQISTTGATVAIGSSFHIVAIKSAVAESYGLLGSYAKVTLTSSTTSASEVFSVELDVMKSFP